MEYRRRRNTVRTQRGEDSSGGAFRALILILVFGAAAYLLIGAGLGKRLKERFSFSLPESCGGVMATPLPSARPEASQEAYESFAPSPSPAAPSAEVSLPPIDIYMIQMGIFDSYENCAAAAETVKALGAAGCVYVDNGSYRLILSAYSDADSAENVRRKLLDEGRQTSIYKQSFGGVELRITAPEEKLAPIRTAFSLAFDTISQLDELAIDLDAKQMTTEEGMSVISEIRTNVKSVRDSIREEKDADRMLAYLDSYYSDLNGLIGECASSAYDKIAFSSAVKELRVKASLRYSRLLGEIGS